jgi:hypothetical protein
MWPPSSIYESTPIENAFYRWKEEVALVSTFKLFGDYFYTVVKDDIDIILGLRYEEIDATLIDEWIENI